MGFAYPDYKLTQAAGEPITPAGNARLTCFGPGDSPLQPGANIEEAVSAVKSLHTDDIDVQRPVFHDWNTDKYTNVAWSCFPPWMDTIGDVRVRVRLLGRYFSGVQIQRSECSQVLQSLNGIDKTCNTEEERAGDTPLHAVTTYPEQAVQTWLAIKPGRVTAHGRFCHPHRQ